jgi:hypothetical protein
VRETILGVIVVGLVAGLFLGRHTERTRRFKADIGTAKANVEKNTANYKESLRRAIRVGLVVAALVVSAFLYAFVDRPD